MRALLVHNPSAGSGRPTAEELLAALDDSGLSTTYCSSKTGHLDQALSHPADIVIVAGGDGTVGKIARKLIDRRTLIGILPIGTANNIARCLKIDGDILTLARALRGAPVQRLDIATAVGPWGKRHFVESVGWGALAKAVDSDGPKLSRKEKIEWGRESFADILAEAKAEQVSFEADGHRVEGKFILVEILNLGMTGPRMMISPSADYGDQHLDVVYLTESSRGNMIEWLRGKPDDHPPPLDMGKARKVTLTWKDGPLRIDDEVFAAPELESNILIEVEPHGLRVCVPAAG
ncbi:MAG: diacylglycerol/lipid kinase family protein [Methyloceanibacter sp.]